MISIPNLTWKLGVSIGGTLYLQLGQMNVECCVAVLIAQMLKVGTLGSIKGGDSVQVRSLFASPYSLPGLVAQCVFLAGSTALCSSNSTILVDRERLRSSMQQL